MDDVIRIIKPEPDSQFRLVPCPECKSDDVAYEKSAEEVYGKILEMGATMIQTDRTEFLLDYLRKRGLHD